LAVPDSQTLAAALAEFTQREHADRIVSQYASLTEDQIYDAGLYGAQTVPEDWLADYEFKSCMLEPMNLEDLAAFIDHWHTAIVVGSDPSQEVVAAREASVLKRSIRRQSALRRLATSPLLCAMLCALHHDGNTELPQDRVELYDRALEAMLQRPRRRASHLRVTAVEEFVALHELGSLPRLVTLSVRDAPMLTDLTHNDGFPPLRELEVVRCPGIESLGPIRDLEALQQLTVGRPDVLDLEALAGHPSLTRLSVAAKYIDGLAALAELPRLQSVSISSEQAFELFPLVDADELEVVELSACLGPITCAPLGRAKRPLRLLSLHECSDVVDFELMGDIDRLDLVDPSGEVLAKLGDMRIRELELYDDTLRILPALPSRLETLELWCEQLEDISSLPTDRLRSVTLWCASLCDIEPLTQVQGLQFLNVLRLGTDPSSDVFSRLPDGVRH